MLERANMSPTEAITAARAAGIQITVEGDVLVLEASAPPPTAVFDLLSRHKVGIVALLRPGRDDGWLAKDWRAFFEERAGIAEFDGGLPRVEAEARAFGCCGAEWRNRNPVRSPPGRCLACGADRLHLTYRVRIGGGEWDNVAETVRIVRVPCRFGGARSYFICPGVVDGIATGLEAVRTGALFPLPALPPPRTRQPERGRIGPHDAPREQDPTAPRRRSRHGRALPAEAEGHVAANLRTPARASLRRRGGRGRSFLSSSRAPAGEDQQTQRQKEFLAMNKTESTLPVETGGTEITRFNALRHGVLSRYTVLPREDADEYRAVVEALVDEHAPQGPTEEHLVEELAGILWRKRRLRLGQAQR